MKTLIIDNETPIIENLQKMIALFCPYLHLIGTASGVHTGLKAIQTLKPELVFLDVEMDDGTGMDLLKQLPERDFQVVFITAFNQYAVEAFRFSAIDFLPKPIDPTDLIAAVEKARTHRNKEELQVKFEALMENMLPLSQQIKKIVLKDAESIHLVAVSEILWCEADGSYTHFHLLDGRKILVSQNLKSYEKLLQNYGFFRCHHSYLVNLNQVKRFDKTEGGKLIMVNGSMLPVSQRKREQLVGILANL